MKTKLILIALFLNVLVLCLNLSLTKVLRETCDYCHKGTWRESVVERAFRRKTNVPTLHMECANYLCQEGIMEEWSLKNGFDSRHCELARKPHGVQQ